MSDSTNAEVPGFVTANGISRRSSAKCPRRGQRVIVASFSCHVHRVQQVLDSAQTHGRKVALVGRSMVRTMGVARDLGYLQVPGGLVVDLREAEQLPPDRVVLVSTGSQGEPMSALSRMAGRDHPIRVAEGDTVILASSLIPGNETAVYRVINGLTRLGARVVHKGNALVHVSGHAAAGELLYVLNLTRPGNFMPVHGEWRHCARTRSSPRSPGYRTATSSSPRTGSWSTWWTGRPHRRLRPVRVRVRGRAVGGGGDRGFAERPADPGRGGVRLGGHRGRLDQRQARGGSRRSTPAVRASTTRRSARCGRGSRRRSPSRPPRGSTMRTSSASWCGGWSAAG